MQCVRRPRCLESLCCAWAGQVVAASAAAARRATLLSPVPPTPRQLTPPSCPPGRPSPLPCPSPRSSRLPGVPPAYVFCCVCWPSLRCRDCCRVVVTSWRVLAHIACRLQVVGGATGKRRGVGGVARRSLLARSCRAAMCRWQVWRRGSRGSAWTRGHARTHRHTPCRSGARGHVHRCRPRRTPCSCSGRGHAHKWRSRRIPCNGSARGHAHRCSLRHTLCIGVGGLVSSRH